MSTSRRAFLQTGAAAGAALTLGFRLGAAAPAAGAVLKPNAWIRVARDGRVTVTVGKSEMGQGVRTALPMIAAEELGAPWASVDLAQAGPGPDFPRLGTGGSFSVQSLWLPLRQAAAAAREMLIQVAAAQWGVAPGTCRAAQGQVTHPASGRVLGFGALVPAAAALPVPKDPPLKAAKDYDLVGRSHLRYDGPRLLDGSAQFGLDVKLPGMGYAVVARCPVAGGKAVAWDEPKAKAQPGVRAVVALSSGVAVVADSTSEALDAVAVLGVTWDEGPNRTFDSGAFRTRLAALAAAPAVAVRAQGDAAKGLAAAGRRLEALYEFPWQAHATLEPPNCVAHAKADSCELWVGSQSPNDLQTRVAKLLGLPATAVKVNVTLIGGGFGRRLRSDYATEAAELSRAIQGPVQVLWTREDDLRHDRYHPMSLHRLEAGLEAGALTTWLHRVAAPSIGLSWADGKRSPNLAVGETLGAVDSPYAAANVRVEYAEADCPVPLGWWRGIQVAPNTMARECFLDEVAAALGEDPLALRLRLLGEPRVLDLEGEKVDVGRLKAVLELAARKGDWGRPLPPGHGRGLACCPYEGRSYVAEVVEVSVLKGVLKVHRVTAAADCGLVVNPIGAQAQVEGGIIWGLSAMHSRITFKGGRVEQGSYSDFPVLRLKDAPRIDVHLMPSQASPTGLGEPPVPPLFPAVLNAIFAATGRRLRRLPLAPEDFS